MQGALGSALDHVLLFRHAHGRMRRAQASDHGQASLARSKLSLRETFCEALNGARDVAPLHDVRRNRGYE